MNPSRDDLRKYYELFFPCEQIYNWLTLGTINDQDACELFHRRELVFVTENGKFVREEFTTGSKKEFKDILNKRIPVRIETISINTVPYHDRHIAGPGFSRLEKDLGFDIDINDYDPVRYCCRDKNYCRSCWIPLMGTSVKLITKFMERSFGPKKLLWVYSGRRGMHCWVVDEKSRKYSSIMRVNIVKKMQMVFCVGEPDFETESFRSYREIVLQGMDQYMEVNPDLFKHVEITKYILGKIYNIQTDQGNKMFDTAVAQITKMTREGKKGKDIVQSWLSKVFKSKKKRLFMQYQIALAICMPRIDEKVTTQFSHPMKLPFCVHPSTNRICMVMDSEQAHSFFPDENSVILIKELLTSEPDSKVRCKFQDSVNLLGELIF